MLGAFADVRPEERPGVTGAFLTLFGILAGYTLLETGRDALFLGMLDDGGARLEPIKEDTPCGLSDSSACLP